MLVFIFIFYFYYIILFNNSNLLWISILHQAANQFNLNKLNKLVAVKMKNKNREEPCLNEFLYAADHRNGTVIQ